MKQEATQSTPRSPVHPHPLFWKWFPGWSWGEVRSKTPRCLCTLRPKGVLIIPVSPLHCLLAMHIQGCLMLMQLLAEGPAPPLGP